MGLAAFLFRLLVDRCKYVLRMGGSASEGRGGRVVGLLFVSEMWYAD